jgi:hypothetical protein
MAYVVGQVAPTQTVQGVPPEGATPQQVFVRGFTGSTSRTSATHHTEKAGTQPLPTAATTLLHWQQPASTVVLIYSKKPRFAV